MNLDDFIAISDERVCQIKFITFIPEGLRDNAQVKITKSESSNGFSLEFNGIRCIVSPQNSDDKSLMEYLCNSNGLYVDGYIKKMNEKDQTAFVSLLKFAKKINIPANEDLIIKLDKYIFEKGKDKGRMQSVHDFEKEFLFSVNGVQMAVVMNSNNEEAQSFCMLGRRYQLEIQREKNFYRAKKYKRVKKNMVPLMTLCGFIQFSDNKNVEIGKGTAECISAVKDTNGKYTDIWKKYDELESLIFVEKAIESGVFKYECWKKEINGTMYQYVFTIKNGSSGYIDPSDTIELDATDNDALKKYYDEYMSQGDVENKSRLSKAAEVLKDIKSVYVGKLVDKISETKWIVETDGDNFGQEPPSSGYLYRSIRGDMKIITRRKIAQEKINTQHSGLLCLSDLLNNGEVATVSADTYQPVTSYVIQKLQAGSKKKIEFNDAQLDAIRIAVNTPDIALIQGPPGSGKTTVIRAIAARFEEIYKETHKNTPDNELPKILISSFQHDAVDNAIEKVTTNGLPVCIIGGRQGNAEDERLIQWINDTIAQLENEIEELVDPTLYETTSELRKRYFAWQENNKNYDDGLALIQEFGSSGISELSPKLIQEIGVILKGKKRKAKQSAEDLAIAKLVHKQRLTAVSFMDDGKKNLQELVTYLTFFDASFEIPECIVKMLQLNDDITDDNDVFKQYIAVINELKFQYEPQSETEEIFDVAKVDRCISEIIKQRETAINKFADNINNSKAMILMAYKDSLDDEAKDIIEKYSIINAGTCQQILPTNQLELSDLMYDLVIVDEAARANPSDLFIPMSLGKKIVLVGDQKQLPHMLDPDAVERLKANSDEETMRFYNQSLFERMFDIFQYNEQRGHAAIKRTCSLVDQYRMVEDISNFVRDKIYLPKVDLRCKTNKKPYPLERYEHKAMVWINMDKKHGSESNTTSRYRECEVEQVMKELDYLIHAGEDIQTIGIITFYKEQAIQIQKHVDSLNIVIKPKIGTIDAFQGKEFDVVIFSCSRANDLQADLLHPYKKVGFLDDDNRLCVALSRAQKLLIGIGDADTVQHAKILGEYIQECHNGRGYYLNV